MYCIHKRTALGRTIDNGKQERRRAWTFVMHPIYLSFSNIILELFFSSDMILITHDMCTDLVQTVIIVMIYTLPMYRAVDFQRNPFPRTQSECACVNAVRCKMWLAAGRNSYIQSSLIWRQTIHSSCIRTKESIESRSMQAKLGSLIQLKNHLTSTIPVSITWG